MTRTPSRAGGMLAAYALLLVALAQPAWAQQSGGALAEAHRLGDEGDFRAAADSVRAYLGRNPGDPRVRWFLAQLLYWSGDPRDALPQFQKAVVALPGEVWLRLDQARVLLDLRRYDAADAVLGVVLQIRGADASAIDQALTLRGTTAYWRGDLPEAIGRFEKALARNPGNQEASNQLAEIRRSIRPWAKLGGEVWRDDQPYRRYEGSLELGTYLEPLWTLSGSVTPMLLDASARRSALDGSVRLGGYLPQAHVEVSAAVGVTRAAIGTAVGSMWTGGASLAYRLPSKARVGVRAWRERYLWTATSMDTLLAVRGMEASFDAANATRWAGEAVARRETFPDGNVIHTVYGWALAPVTRWLRAGYSFSWQDSRETRWVTTGDGGTNGVAPGPGSHGPPSATVPGATTTPGGLYAPYFTPEATEAHVILGELSAPLGRAKWKANVSWGVHASEDAPGAVDQTLPGGGTTQEIVFARRTFHPWSIRTSLDMPLQQHGDVRLEVERSHTVFYNASHLTVGWYRRFGSGGASG
ncbi:MAG: tetratricopeptide repeat protein [Gemmatimonadetes bacterium]|nr:tetratricopeptide repeat protein [Gemmatimonadota bacterium]